MIITASTARLVIWKDDEYLRLAPKNWYIRGRADDGFRRVHRRAQVEALDEAFLGASIKA